MEKLNKVASITFYFWVIKIFATTIGETLGDMLSMTLGIGYFSSLIITLIIFLISLFFQLKASKLYIGLYWLVIIGTTTVGTEISDFMDRSLELGYATGSLILFSLLMLVLFVWYKQQKSITYYPITNTKVETFFWIAVLLSNSLGTAFGDFLSDNIGLSYINGALITAGIIGIVVFLHYFTKINHGLLFWVAFIFTRPFGATFGDLLTKPIEKGGLDLGTIPSTIIASILMIIIIVYSTIQEKKLKVN